jgi:hypothetical protein
MLIAIPSCGRQYWKQQVTLRNFITMKSKRKVVLCVPERERRQYNTNVFADVIGRPIKLTVANVPASHSGISHTREWILTELAAQHKERYVMMLDDDMDFSYRPDMHSPALDTIKDPERFEAMFILLEQWLEEGFTHVGISARQGNNHCSTAYCDATRMMNAYAYDVDALQELGVDIGRNPVMHDFDLTLQLLRKGYPNRVSYQYAWNQRGSNTLGGCSSYRTTEVQKASALQLKEDHPDFVTVVTKAANSVWKGMEERSDVNVQWKKALQDGRRNRTLDRSIVS